MHIAARLNERSGSRAAGKNSPIFSSASFSDNSPSANKYLNPMIKFSRKGNEERVAEVESRVMGAKCI